MRRGPIVRCFIAGSIAVLLFFQGHIAYADVSSNNADILFQQTDESGSPIDMAAGGPIGAERYNTIVAEHSGLMAPFLRIRMKLTDSASPTPQVNPDPNATIPITFEIFNASDTASCVMIRTADFPASWANDGTFHNFDWTLSSRVFNPNVNHCSVVAGSTYTIGVSTGHSNLLLSASANGAAIPYVIGSVEPLDVQFPPSAAPYPNGVLWQSVASHDTEVSIYGSNGPFNGTRPNTTIPLGIWDGPDFTSDASTTVHIWMRSGDPQNATTLDVGLAASSGGNPYSSSPSNVANILYAPPPLYSATSAGWIPVGAQPGTSLQEVTVPVNAGLTIHHGDEIWGYAYPAFASSFYNGGVNVFMGGVGDVPQFQICANDCNALPLETATVTAPVIIIPGIMGSAQHNGVWEIDPITHGFDNLIDTLLANGYTKDVDLFTFPYDWHKSNVDTAVLLKQKIDAVKAICGCDKVDLVAHSMGGLVARQYIQSSSYDHDVRNMIFIGTPHLGAPEVYTLWEGGVLPANSLQNLFVNMLINNEAQEAGLQDTDGRRNFDYIRNTPVSSIQELLPTYDYLQNTGNYTSIRDEYPSQYPRNTFLESLNANIDKLTSSDVAITNFVGELSGSSTVSQIRVAPPAQGLSPLWPDGLPQSFGIPFTDQGLEGGSGDEKVPFNSASFVKQNLKVFNANHGDLITAAEEDIFKTLTGKDAGSLVTGKSYYDVPMLFVEVYSPVDLQIVTPSGARVGKDLSTGGELKEVPGAFYTGYLTEHEFLIIPNPQNGKYKIITQGTGNGGEYTLEAGVISNATSSRTYFSGQTLPGLITEHNVNIDASNPSETSITPADQTPPIITLLQPATSTYTHADFLPVKITFTDPTGVASSSVSFDTQVLSASDTVDLFYETLGSHIIKASSIDLLNNATSSKKTISVVATASSTVSDVQREYLLGWIRSKTLRDSLIAKLNTSIKLNKITDTIVVSTKPLVTKKVDRWVQIFDTIILKSALFDLALAKASNQVNAQGYQVLTADINWLLSH